MSNVYRSSKLLETIVKNQFYNCAANGDVVLMAALTRLVCFCLQFDKASYHHIKALKIEYKIKHNRTNITEADSYLQIFNIQDAILGYNSCYDTLLQAIKFAFKLVNSIESEKDFLKALDNCKWISNESKSSIGIKDLLTSAYANTNNTFNSFIKKSTSFFESKRQKNAKYANNIKHNGGIIVPSLKTYIPNVLKDNKDILSPNGGCKFDVSRNKDLFKMECLYPLEIKPKEALQLLNNQNQWIYDYVNYLFEVLQYNQLKDLEPLSGKYIFPFESLKT